MLLLASFCYKSDLPQFRSSDPFRFVVFLDLLPYLLTRYQLVDFRIAREAYNVAATRLRRRPCHWNDCFHVANCAKSLETHVRDHVDLIPEKVRLRLYFHEDSKLIASMRTGESVPVLVGRMHAEIQQA